MDLLAPSAAPENVKCYSSSSTAIRVTWTAAPTHNGIIVSYSVSYQAVGGSYEDSRTRHKQVTGSSTQTDLTGLEESVIYNITVSASTSAGKGPSSIEITVRTGEAGKTFNCDMLSL